MRRTVGDGGAIVLTANGRADFQIGRPFTWMRVHNRGAAGADVAVSFAGPCSTDPAVYDDVFVAGERRVRNFGKGPTGDDPDDLDEETGDILPSQLHFVNLSATVPGLLYVEVADEPIVDLKGS